MKKTQIKKLLISSLIALQLNTSFNNSMITVAAKEPQENNEILLEDNGKTLQLIGMIIDNYQLVTMGYKFSKDNCIFFEDAVNGRIYNLSLISKHWQYPELVYTEAINVLPNELTYAESITKEQAAEIINKFSITDTTVRLSGIEPNEWEDFIYQTFTAEGFDNTNLHIANSSLFNDAYSVFDSWTVTDDFDEEKEILNPEANNYKLGIFENESAYGCYSNIYQNKPIKYGINSGIITRYYVFDTNNNYICSLYTQEQIDTFLEEHKEDIANYTWKAAFYANQDIDDILTTIDNNQIVPSENTTYFIDYKPKMLKREN